jgi:hypothetical protein
MLTSIAIFYEAVKDIGSIANQSNLNTHDGGHTNAAGAALSRFVTVWTGRCEKSGDGLMERIRSV